MRWLSVLGAILCLIASAVPGLSQDLESYVSVAPTPPWVEPARIDQTPFDLAQDDPVEHLLIDRQARYGRDERRVYRHVARRLNTTAAVEENSVISAELDPEYERIVFHAARVWRDGIARDVLDLSKFDLYRVETDRERLIYNGTLEVSHVLRDLRVGDIVEVAYSVVGKNPAFGPHYRYYAQQNYGVPVRHIRSRLLVPTKDPIHLRTLAGATTPETSRRGDYDVYLWDQKDVLAVPLEDSQPPDLNIYAVTMVSTFETWADVGRFFSGYYDAGHDMPAELVEVAATIATEHETDDDRLRAALDFVQREIRYLGIELGAGGYIPRTPEQVLDRRFGDCKDMVFLLTALLGMLDIEAAPLLVNTTRLGAVAEWQPSPTAFDHVIVAATSGGVTYFLDPTRGPQLGDLQHLDQARFGKGLVISPTSAGMIEIDPPTPDFYVKIKDHFYFDMESDVVRLTDETEYFAYQADGMLNWMASDGSEQVEKEYLDYFQTLFPGLEADSPMEIQVFEAEGRVRFVSRYRIPNGWRRSEDDPDIRIFQAQPDDLLSYLPSFDGGDRKTPYALDHPMRVSHELRAYLDDTWHLLDSDQSFSQPSFQFDVRERSGGGVYSHKSTYLTKSDRIAPQDFEASMAAISKIRTQTGMYLTHDTSFVLGTPDEDVNLYYLAYSVLVMLTSATVAIWIRNQDASWRTQQVFYPVTPAKFIIMSIGTLGLYQVYWTYKNWQWIRVVRGEKVSPIWRTIFSPLTNFSLFPRLGREDAPNWFAPLAIPLAVAHMLAWGLDSYLGSQVETPVFLRFLVLALIFLSLPAALHIRRLNKENSRPVVRNSEFGGYSILALLAYFPLLVGYLLGIG